ncbi:MAG: hypothetical protein EOO56_11505 [Hymenobacter sp.]|nr:MAG: hypothetical protein EOO56_11505 [Hymenobacter sp.]
MARGCATPCLLTTKRRSWRVDPGVVLDKLVVDFGGLTSYLGPPGTTAAAASQGQRTETKQQAAT